MTGDDPEAEPPPRIWADWGQRDSTGLVWTFAADSDHPERLRPGALVWAGPRGDVRPARVVDILPEPWRTVVLLREVPTGEQCPG